MLSAAGQLSVTFMVSIFSLLLWSLEYNPTNAIKTYSMEEECGEELSLIFDSVYQGKLVFKPRTSSLSSCIVTIEAWYSMPYLMFHVTHLNISCTDGYVEFGDGRDGGQNISGLEGRVCNSYKPEVLDRMFSTNSQYLRVKYTRINPDIQTNIELFSIIFTAYSSGPCRNDQFRCSNGMCIHEDVRCSGHNSCGDKSDCKHELSSITTAGIVAASLVGLCILATIVIMVLYHCYCKKNNETRTSSRMCSSSRSIGHHDNTLTWHGSGMLSIVSGQQPAYPRNWSYSGHQEYNTAGNPPINVNTNIHCWFVADRNQHGVNNTGDRPPESDDDLDDNWTKDEQINNDIESDKIDNGREHKENFDKSGADNEVYIEDEVIPDDEMDERRMKTNGLLNSRNGSRGSEPKLSNMNEEDKRIQHEMSDKTSDDLNSVGNMCGSSSDNPFCVDDGSNNGDFTIDSADIKIRKARVNSDADEIDQSFADFYRDLLPGNYYNDAFRLDEAEPGEQITREGNGLENRGVKLNDSFESSAFSTDL